MTTIEIIDRSPIFAEGLAHILECQGLSVLRTGSRFGGATPAADVLVADSLVWSGDRDRFAGFAGRVLLTVEDLEDRPRPPAGTQGMIDRCAEPRTLLEAVRALAHNQRFVEQRFAEVLEADGAAKPSACALSRREHQVIQLISRGMTHGQIARRLELSPHTVDTYVRRVRAKLNLGNKAELTRAALLS